MNFSPMTVGEVLPKGFDLARNLAVGESISSAVFSVVVVRGTNPDTAAMVTGDVTLLGAKVWQKIAALVVGYYEVRARITTSTGAIYIERGTLEVVA